jgi:hypothetical protein
MPLTPETLAAWQAELRNPENKQAKEMLTQVLPDGSFADCCLGLLCRKVEHIIPVIRPEDTVGPNERVLYDGQATTVLPESVQKKYNITANGAFSLRVGTKGNTLLDREGHTYQLASCNDKGLTFAQIADLLDYFELASY